MIKIALHSLGCKVNAYETEQMENSLEKAGYEIVSFRDMADIYIINTCSVTNIADRKSRQMLHRAKSLNPSSIVVAAGCYANTRDRSEILSDNVDLIVLNEEKKEIVNIIDEYCRSHNIVSSIPDKPDDFVFQSDNLHTRVFFKVQDGCNQFCSYCIIPYARGRIKSRPIKELLPGIRSFADKGYSEFVLTGIHLSSYGKDRPDDGEDLISLIEAVAEIPGVKRLRLSSLEPRIITPDFVSRLTSIKEFCPQFHLSLQSGSDSVLKRMNRHYTTDEYFAGVELLRSSFDHPAITTDVIVGFPGESEEEFGETVRFLEKVNFYETHVFKYSRRAGTVADKMDDQLTDSLKSSREKVLLNMTAERKKAFADYYLNSAPVEVLIEDNNEGYTREYVRVRALGDFAPGTILTGHITARINDDIMEFTPNVSGGQL
ncbi:MAG: tRNA (N(6)-L-threonylcarbamoyladenosine(37)-C(2))-methylthiotransferase MtaB [Lachnospiraceae bacterium]|nr:tRNA (N(6)-L-threonylcarbamoyladenosine(37)-C(2))-methylthiotransferase MtaB [Lachnospiraceae bacterium]